ncbi:uncharacterized protein LOC128201512 [Galleria mellonella]|uniref:Uncharacterized protein LOC128201512 n=1 Tax=Galleria mellonella TaxID=7137 RepID=A0ABM3MTG0_GALME|nr:uncharacterized protein LOC128201512 [Galleria mellonella]
MSCTVKCATCNIVIDELLSYIQNKISIADEESLVKICASSFTSEQVQKSHTLLFESVSSELRRIARKGKGKGDRLLYDILSFFKVTDPDMLPIFVARDLEKLPPITWDHLDVSKVLKDLLIVQSEIKTIKSSYATVKQLEEVKKECYNLKTVSPPFSAAKINIKRGAYRDSGPIALSVMDESTISNHEDESSGEMSSTRDNNLHYRNININTNYPEGSSDTLIDATFHQTFETENSRVTDNTKRDESLLTCNRQSTQPTVGKVGTTLVESYAGAVRSNNEWTIVEKKRKKNRRIEGKLGTVVIGTDEMFRAAERKIPLFITNVHKNTSESDIVRYICKMTQETVALEKISIKRQCDYNAFKFFVAQNKVSLFLDENIWPEGIIFRRFINFKLKKSTGNAHISIDGITHQNYG